MKAGPEQLADTLRKGLAPVYLLSGDEPLQLTEAADAIRQAARAAGYGHRELLYVDAGFDWGFLEEARDARSLFGEPRVIDLRLAAKPDRVGAAALARYAERPPEDAILLATLPKLGKPEQNARWFQALDKIGVVVQVWPLEEEKLLRWLDRRLNSRGLLADRSSLRLLAARVEGNLLAAAQEVEKLQILYGKGSLSDEQILKAVSDSSRFDVFDLAEEALKGHAGRACRVLAGLRAEGVAAPVALWALTRELRLLLALKAAVGAGTSLESAFAAKKIWDSRKQTLTNALRRLDHKALHEALLLSARADRVIKGAEPGEEWDAVLSVCLAMIQPGPLPGWPGPPG